MLAKKQISAANKKEKMTIKDISSSEKYTEEQIVASFKGITFSARQFAALAADKAIVLQNLALNESDLRALRIKVSQSIMGTEVDSSNPDYVMYEYLFYTDL